MYNTPLILAVERKDEESTKQLLRKGADPNVSNREGIRKNQNENKTKKKNKKKK